MPRYCVQSPNDGMPGQIHPMAVRQLEIYEDVARHWTKYRDGNCVRCEVCNQNIYFLADKHGVIYSYTREEIMALTVAHIRQCHAEVVDSGIE